jgi:hypothetical protein
MRQRIAVFVLDVARPTDEPFRRCANALSIILTCPDSIDHQGVSVDGRTFTRDYLRDNITKSTPQ